jgi:multicomponent K+:H+ antiporter subunit G
MTTVPPQVEAVVAALALIGALAALVGSFGLVSLASFFQRAHAPTLGTTLGTWSLALALAFELSFAREQPFVHALLVPVFVTMTAPVTTIFLMRAAIFRRRLAPGGDVPASARPGSIPRQTR